MAANGGFLARWSKRKRAASDGQAELPPEASALAPASAGEDAAPVHLNLPDVPDVDEPEFDLASLPTLDEVTGSSDMSAFLQKGVPEALQNAALRKAWVLDPFIRDHIGPVECGWDFNDPKSMTGFGPLDANVDPVAMLKQIMGGAKKDAEIPDDAVLEQVAPADDPADARSAVGSQQETTGQTDPCLPDASGDAERADSLKAGQSSIKAHAATHNDSVDKIEEIPVAFRKRRHGGAVPG